MMMRRVSRKRAVEVERELTRMGLTIAAISGLIGMSVGGFIVTLLMN